jgi:hypothetical protein
MKINTVATATMLSATLAGGTVLEAKAGVVIATRSARIASAHVDANHGMLAAPIRKCRWHKKCGWVCTMRNPYGPKCIRYGWRCRSVCT